MRRRRSRTPEERAEVLSQQGYMASGNSYISVVLRETKKQGRVPYYRDPEKCDHGVSMCPTWECIESWSMDYEVNLPLTVAGRELADKLGIDPVKFALANRKGIEVLKREDFVA
jgi:DsbC/DsbD-like thiol-disulfide interchange protein